jgi:hypothetical protein
MILLSIKVNGVKKITDLTAASTINDADVFMIETTSGSRKVTGATLKTLINNLTPDVDATLSTTGQAADAKVTGDAIQAMHQIIANDFDASLSYVAGDYVIYEGKLYQFSEDHETGIFDGTDAVEVNVTDEMVKDVTIDGISIVSEGVATVPIGKLNEPGVVSYDNQYGNNGIVIVNGAVRTSAATLDQMKLGVNGFKPIVATTQHISTFYGLAKAAGDTTQSQSSNAVGTYTEEAKSAISEMLGGAISITGTAPSINAKAGVRYICGEVLTLDITLPASGIVDVVFTSGSTPTVLTITPPTGQTVKWANGFDSTALDADTTYEINIMDGLGVAIGWT